MAEHDLGRLRALDARPISLDGFSVADPELGLVALTSPHDPEPSLVVLDGRVVELDGRAEADFDIIDTFVARHGIDLAVATEAMVMSDRWLALPAASDGSLSITAANAGLPAEREMVACSTTKVAAVQPVEPPARDQARCDGTRADALCPGDVDTPFNAPVWANDGGRDAFVAEVGTAVPRVGGRPARALPAERRRRVRHRPDFRRRRRRVS